MNELELLMDLHRDGDRQGPGSNAVTEQALSLAGWDPHTPLALADIGCGTGASTLVLARQLRAHITAVDLLPEFLERLTTRATEAGVAEAITPLCASMDDLPLEDASLDGIWSEGAIYHIGFQAGVTQWRRFLKPGGLLAVSELSWTTHERPAELQQHWEAEYPEVGTASAKMRVLEEAGYTPIGYLMLPEACWKDHYYTPMQARLQAFLSRNGHSAAAQAIVDAEESEVALYERFKAFYSYGFYLARKNT